MQNAWNRFKDNAIAISVLVAAVVVLGGLIQYTITQPLNQRFDDLRADLNSRFDAQNKRIDDFKDAMNGRFDIQDKSIHERFEAVGQRFDAQDKYINQRFDTVDQRFDAQDKRLERLENDVSELRKLGEHVSQHDLRIDTLEKQLHTADAPSP